MAQGAWEAERVERLKALHAERKSAREIARALGPDLTRNAVLGKLFRLGLSTPTPLRPR
jgi:GcrA cell cycle regulator